LWHTFRVKFKMLWDQYFPALLSFIHSFDEGLSFLTSQLLCSLVLGFSMSVGFLSSRRLVALLFYFIAKRACAELPDEGKLCKINKLLFAFTETRSRAKLSCDKSRSIAHAVQLGVFISETPEHTAKHTYLLCTAADE